jgi:hypothetical protein
VTSDGLFSVGEMECMVTPWSEIFILAGFTLSNVGMVLVCIIFVMNDFECWVMICFYFRKTLLFTCPSYFTGLLCECSHDCGGWLFQRFRWLLLQLLRKLAVLMHIKCNVALHWHPNFCPWVSTLTGNTKHQWLDAGIMWWELYQKHNEKSWSTTGSTWLDTGTKMWVMEERDYCVELLGCIGRKGVKW